MITGVGTYEYTWRSRKSEQGAQIDLLIDRKDGVINLCEIKFTNDPYQPDQEEYTRLMNRLSVFQKETNTRKAIHLTLISVNGIGVSQYASAFQSVITGDDLFH